ncbi:unnamed protein product [Coregonus sp. 'balchen']|nr:unnamed protein product [Coregonus sp. 'balchen']
MPIKDLYSYSSAVGQGGGTPFASSGEGRITAVRVWENNNAYINGSATVMYVVAAAVDAASISHAVKGRHNYNCWVASTFFAFLVTLCYAGSTFLSFKSWRSRDEEQ